MPSNFGSNDSKWSGERERQERERQREAQKELMRQARLEREAKDAREAEEKAEAARAAESSAPKTPRLSRAEREALRRAGNADTSVPVGETETGGAPPQGAAPTRSTRSSVGNRWRSAAGVLEPNGDQVTSLPDLPGTDKRGGSVNSRILIFGAVLFAVMAIFFFLPFGPFNGDDSPTPTPTSEVIAELPTIINAQGTAEAAPVATRPSDKNTVVCIDPGHGGWDYGFQRPWEWMTDDAPTMNESELNLGMAFMLKDMLEAEGITVVMTRTTGSAVNTYGADVNGNGRTIFDGSDDGERRQNGDWDELQARVNICNAANADLMISLHINGWENTEDSPRGYEVLYVQQREFGPLNAELANDVYRRLSRSMTDAGYTGPGRNAKPDDDLEQDKYEFGSADHLLLLGPDYDEQVRKFTASKMPGIICEPLFLSSDEDANFIADPANQQVIVQAYADGIIDYFAKHPG